MSVPINDGEGKIVYNLQVLSLNKKNTSLPRGFSAIDNHLLFIIASVLQLKF
jgi:hypothetical protein